MTEPRMCECGNRLADTDNVRAALKLWDEVDGYGNLHVYVDDGNLDDDCFEHHEGDFPGHRTAREVVRANEAEASLDALMVEFALVGILEESTEEERYAAYGLCWDCVQANRKTFAEMYGDESPEDRLFNEPIPGPLTHPIAESVEAAVRYLANVAAKDVGLASGRTAFYHAVVDLIQKFADPNKRDANGE